MLGDGEKYTDKSATMLRLFRLYIESPRAFLFARCFIDLFLLLGVTLTELSWRASL